MFYSCNLLLVVRYLTSRCLIKHPTVLFNFIYYAVICTQVHWTLGCFGNPNNRRSDVSTLDYIFGYFFSDYAVLTGKLDGRDNQEQSDSFLMCFGIHLIDLYGTNGKLHQQTH